MRRHSDSIPSDFSFMHEPGDAFDHHYNRGRHLLASHSYTHALEQLRQALSLNPTHAPSHALMALCLANTQRLPAAEHEADLALQGDPDNAYFFYVKGVVLAQGKKWKPAREMARQAVELDPDEDSYHALLAYVAHHLEDYAQSEIAARLALDLNPENAMAQLYLGYTLLERKRYDESRACFETALKLDPDDSDAHNGIGLFYLRTKDPTRALHHIREALRLDPSDLAAQHNLALAMGAKNPFYGLFWRWNLFLAGFGRNARVGIILGLYIFMRALIALGDTQPQWKPLVGVVAIVYIVFCLYTWLADPLFRWWLRRKQPF